MDKESCWVILPDGQIFLVAEGDTDGVNVSVEQIFAIAFLHMAKGLILIHNHPDNNVNPSPQDLMFTSDIQFEGLKRGVKIIDHLIIGGNVFSFKDNGLLD